MTGYNKIAGQSVERLGALSDGVFAIAMTILVLDLRAPAVELVRNDGDLWRALATMGPKLVAYVLSFMTLGIFWVGQQSQLHLLKRTERGVTWIHLFLLLMVSMVPFSTTLLGQFTDFRVALWVYWLNSFLMGLALYLAWRCAWSQGLVKDSTTEAMNEAIRHRVVLSQSLYFCGALLAFVNPRWSIAAIFALQLNYVFAPRWLRKLG